MHQIPSFGFIGNAESQEAEEEVQNLASGGSSQMSIDGNGEFNVAIKIWFVMNISSI